MNEKKIKLNKNNTNQFINKEKEKRARKLSYNFFFNSSYYNSILFLNLLFLYFCFNLLFSFLVGDNECEQCCCHCCRGGSCDCNCNCNNNGDGNGILVCIILILLNLS